MSKRQRVALARYRIISLAVSIAVEDHEDDCLIVGGIKRKSPIYWMQPFLKGRTDERQRNSLAKLEADLVRLGCFSEFFKTTRMDPDIHTELLNLVRPLIQRQDTNFWPAISVEERLSLTIRYLTRGDSVLTLHQGYLIGESSVLPIVRDTCRAIFWVLHEEHLKTPSTEAEWLSIAKGFHDKWNIPNVLGAVDGKHCRIKCPKKSGSLFFNYKLYFSVLLLAVVDSDYKFIYVDVGAEGISSDSTLWQVSKFHQDMNSEENPLHIPAATTVPGYAGELGYFFVGDDAFTLTHNLMKPYPTAKLTMSQRIYNYRISRCRRVVENSFGILSTRFRILRREIDQEPEGVSDVVMACVVLHNFLRVRCGRAYLPREAADWEGRDYTVHKGQWRAEEPLPGRDKNLTKKNHSVYVKKMRDNLMQWCLTKEGQVPWQYQLVLGALFYR